MDPNIQRALTDKLYDKRKSGALELEGLIRDSLAANDHERISRIVNQLCHDYAYQVHQPHARNGGLIGLAAAAIALGPVWETSCKQCVVSDGVNRQSSAISKKSSLQYSPASPTKMHVYDTTLAKACTILPKWPRERFLYTSTRCLMR